ncbi:MAG: alpha/beta hydrolase [Bryobacteraceae bacterium]|nr:alpha/beta hydrolase [Bryobacteraceae bacterium]
MKLAPGLLAGLPLAAQLLTFHDVRAMPPPAADFRILYGNHPLQYADLRLPAGAGPHPVVILIHGGCWQSSINLDNIAMLAFALARDGIATYSIEYRRVGDSRWPDTFRDVAAAVDSLRATAKRHPLDLNRVAIAGHSAGGHLALWAAARGKLKPESPLYRADPLIPKGVVSLAGVPDLRAAAAEKVCGNAIIDLVGGDSGRFAETSPLEMLPLGVPQHLVDGVRDSIVVPKWGDRYRAAARKSGDNVTLTQLPEAGHFELIVPSKPAYNAVKQAIAAMLAAK